MENKRFGLNKMKLLLKKRENKNKQKDKINKRLLKFQLLRKNLKKYKRKNLKKYKRKNLKKYKRKIKVQNNKKR